MKPHHTLAALFLAFTVHPAIHAQDEIRYFQLITPAANGQPQHEDSVSLWVSGESAGGTRFSGGAEVHSAFGSLLAEVRPDGIIHATWNYEIEGSQQSEEQLMKLDGDTLYLGTGELEEHGPGQMVLKDPGTVAFEVALKEVEVREPALDSEEAEPVAGFLKQTVSKLAGAPVSLDGSLRLTGGWARFVGFVTTADGAEATNEAFASRMGDEFQIQLKQDGEKGWTLIRHGFRNAEGFYEIEEATEDFETAPWPLEEELFVP